MKGDFRILYVEDEDDFRGSVLQLLGVYNDVDGAATFEEAADLIRRNAYDVVILDKTLGDRNGLDLIPEVKSENPNAVVIILTGDSDFNSVKKCIVRGADDYVVKSGNIVADLLVRIPVAVARAASDRKLVSLEKQLKQAFRYELVGTSKANATLRAEIYSLRGFKSNVLVTGESGTGKELVARMLNAIEHESRRPFEAMNCAAIPPNLVESTLFGHKKGAFTGATADQPGKFELAHGGDLFLDEVAELPLDTQAKLLRVLQEGEFHRVGADKPITVSCRVIAATNKNLEELVAKKLFREDLYYRLNVVRIRTAPLRDRLEDIADLAQMFLIRHEVPGLAVSDHALKRLRQHDWPGNIRELRNVIERAVIAAARRDSKQIGLQDISIDSPLESPEAGFRRLGVIFPNERHELSPEGFEEFLRSAEREYLRKALHLVGGGAAEVASVLGIGRSTIFRKIQDLGLQQAEPVVSVDLRVDGVRVGATHKQSNPMGR